MSVKLHPAALSLLLLLLSFTPPPLRSADPAVAPDAADWTPLFAPDLSNAVFPGGGWTVEDGVFTASEDQVLWSDKEYADFDLNLEFRNSPGTNSGVIVYCSNEADWIPNSVEIQIADDFSKEWSEKPGTWQCAAFFGHLAATHGIVKQPGEWNHMRVTCRGPVIQVELNGEHVNKIDLRDFTSATRNPDGSEIPPWLSKPLSSLPTRGTIGFQGRHAGAPIEFRNIRIRALP